MHTGARRVAPATISTGTGLWALHRAATVPSPAQVEESLTTGSEPAAAQAAQAEFTLPHLYSLLEWASLTAQADFALCFPPTPYSRVWCHGLQKLWIQDFTDSSDSDV